MSAEAPRRAVRPRGRRRLRRCGGFTLLEVVIAVAIAALALLAMFQAASGGLMAVETAGRVDEAVERAQSHLAALGHGATIVSGDMAGEDGGGFKWHLVVTPVATRAADTNPGGAPAAALYAVEVEISWQERGHRKSVVLSTMRLGTPE